MSKDIVSFLREYGFNPIKIIGNLYLVRLYSKRYIKHSIYLPQIIKKPLDKDEDM